ncbi:putative membrane protein YczE [Marihabitans asiaticum]|uniref:Putative membrane protein YczE n=1 Tax=Marihabitans asiaticum TaxID=415218 RepID=A0A560W7Y3_9MICO|nr:putative membrane protein YczE [Marihabitans asiaticum]
MRRNVPLVPLTPREQLRAGRLPLRLSQLMVGLVLYGVAMGMLVRSTLGLDPWDVFHDGVQKLTGLSFGTVVILTGVAVLAFWVPLRQWPGVGTVANTVVIGLATDATLALLTAPESLLWRWVLLLGGIVVNGAAGAIYIGSQLGPGPRDGLMTGLAQRTGLSIRLVRTSLELTVLAAGWLLGGVVGLGTVLYALLIGPTIQFFLPLVTVDISERAEQLRAQRRGSALESEGEGEDGVGPGPSQEAPGHGEGPARVDDVVDEEDRPACCGQR